MTRRIYVYNRETGQVEETAESVAIRTNPRWPLPSTAAGVLPSQVKDAQEFCRRSGVPTEYTSSGEPIWTGPGHRRKFLRAWQRFDKDGFD